MLIIYAYSFTVRRILHNMPKTSLILVFATYFPLIVALRKSLWHVSCVHLKMSVFYMLWRIICWIIMWLLMSISVFRWYPVVCSLMSLNRSLEMSTIIDTYRFQICFQLVYFKWKKMDVVICIFELRDKALCC